MKVTSKSDIDRLSYRLLRIALASGLNGELCKYAVDRCPKLVKNRP